MPLPRAQTNHSLTLGEGRGSAGRGAGRPPVRVGRCIGEALPEKAAGTGPRGRRIAFAVHGPGTQLGCLAGLQSSVLALDVRNRAGSGFEPLLRAATRFAN